MDFQNVALDACREKGCDLAYLIRCGSHAYGTNTLTSDLDIRGVFVPSWSGLVGMHPIKSIVLEPDIELKSLREFVRLCADGNPNILDWLFVVDGCVHLCSPFFRKYILDNRDLFLSKRLHHRFRGYAYSHLQKMERGVTRHLGEKRKENIKEFGYSTKNAMHLIRLARMGCEVLEAGNYNTFREDAEELLAIREGKWKIEDIKGHGADLLARMDAALETTALPNKPDIGVINAHLIKCTMETKRYG